MGGPRRNAPANPGIASQLLGTMFGESTADAEKERQLTAYRQHAELAERRHAANLQEVDAGLAASLLRIHTDAEQYQQRQVLRTSRDLARTRAQVWRSRQQAIIAIGIVVLVVLAATVLCGLSVAAWGLAP